MRFKPARLCLLVGLWLCCLLSPLPAQANDGGMMEDCRYRGDVNGTIAASMNCHNDQAQSDCVGELPTTVSQDMLEIGIAVTDIVTLVNLVLQQGSGGCQADVNNDHTTNVLDVILVVNGILGDTNLYMQTANLEIFDAVLSLQLVQGIEFESNGFSKNVSIRLGQNEKYTNS